MFTESGCGGCALGAQSLCWFFALMFATGRSAGKSCVVSQSTSPSLSRCSPALSLSLSLSISPTQSAISFTPILVLIYNNDNRVLTKRFRIWMKITIRSKRGDQCSVDGGMRIEWMNTNLSRGKTGYSEEISFSLMMRNYSWIGGEGLWIVNNTFVAIKMNEWEIDRERKPMNERIIV